MEKRIEQKETERNGEENSNPPSAPGPGNILRREIDRSRLAGLRIARIARMRRKNTDPAEREGESGVDFASRSMHLPGFLPAGQSQDGDGWASKFALSHPCKSVSSVVN